MVLNNFNIIGKITDYICKVPGVEVLLSNLLIDAGK